MADDLNNAVIHVLVKSNPKKPGTGAYDRFNLYTKGMTVKQYLKAGGLIADIRWDAKQAFIKVDGIKAAPTVKPYAGPPAKAPREDAKPRGKPRPSTAAGAVAVMQLAPKFRDKSESVGKLAPQQTVTKAINKAKVEMAVPITDRDEVRRILRPAPAYRVEKPLEPGAMVRPNVVTGTIARVLGTLQKSDWAPPVVWRDKAFKPESCTIDAGYVQGARIQVDYADKAQAALVKKQLEQGHYPTRAAPWPEEKKAVMGILARTAHALEQSMWELRAKRGTPAYGILEQQYVEAVIALRENNVGPEFISTKISPAMAAHDRNIRNVALKEARALCMGDDLKTVVNSITALMVDEPKEEEDAA